MARNFMGVGGRCPFDESACVWKKLRTGRRVLPIDRELVRVLAANGRDIVKKDPLALASERRAA